MRDIVKRVDREAPFLQTVQLDRFDSFGVRTRSPRFNTYGVEESVVAAPEVRCVAGRVAAGGVVVARADGLLAAGLPEPVGLKAAALAGPL